MGVTNEGITYTIDLAFPATPSNVWYIGLINNTPAPSLLPGDTLASHTGWSEALYGVAYSGAARKLWTNGAISGNQMSNSVAIQFAMLQALTIYGIFLTKAATGTSDTMFGTVQFVGGPQLVAISDTIEVIFTLTGASS